MCSPGISDYLEVLVQTSINSVLWQASKDIFPKYKNHSPTPLAISGLSTFNPVSFFPQHQTKSLLIVWSGLINRKTIHFAQDMCHKSRSMLVCQCWECGHTGADRDQLLTLESVCHWSGAGTLSVSCVVSAGCWRMRRFWPHPCQCHCHYRVNPGIATLPHWHSTHKL